MALLKFIEPYIAVASQCVIDPNSTLNGKMKCICTWRRAICSIDENVGRIFMRRCSRSPLRFNLIVPLVFKTWICVLVIKLKEVFPWQSRDMVMARTPVQFLKYPADVYTFDTLLLCLMEFSFKGLYRFTTFWRQMQHIAVVFQ